MAWVSLVLEKNDGSIRFISKSLSFTSLFSKDTRWLSIVHLWIRHFTPVYFQSPPTSILSSCWWYLPIFQGKVRWLHGGSHCPKLGCRSWPAWPLCLSPGELLGSSPINSSHQSPPLPPPHYPSSWRNNDRQQGSHAHVQSWVHPRKTTGGCTLTPSVHGPMDSSSNVVDLQWFVTDTPTWIFPADYRDT